MAIFLPAYKPTYYEASGDTLSYYITTGDETIFTGKAWKNPSTNTVKIRLDEIFRDYLKMKTENGGGDLKLHPDAFKYFYLYDASGSLLQGYGVLYDWGKEFDGSSMVLSDPIKPEVPFNVRLDIPFTVYSSSGETIAIEGVPIIRNTFWNLITQNLTIPATGGSFRVEWLTDYLPASTFSAVAPGHTVTGSLADQSGITLTFPERFSQTDDVFEVYYPFNGGERVFSSTTVTQKANVFTLNPSTLLVPSLGGTFTIHYTTDLPYTGITASAPSWPGTTFSDFSATSCIITVPPNPTYSDYTFAADFKWTSGGTVYDLADLSVTIKQKGGATSGDTGDTPYLLIDTAVTRDVQFTDNGTFLAFNGTSGLVLVADDDKVIGNIIRKSTYYPNRFSAGIWVSGTGDEDWQWAGDEPGFSTNIPLDGFNVICENIVPPSLPNEVRNIVDFNGYVLSATSGNFEAKLLEAKDLSCSVSATTQYSSVTESSYIVSVYSGNTLLDSKTVLMQPSSAIESSVHTGYLTSAATPYEFVDIRFKSGATFSADTAVYKLVEVLILENSIETCYNDGVLQIDLDLNIYQYLHNKFSADAIKLVPENDGWISVVTPFPVNIIAGKRGHTEAEVFNQMDSIWFSTNVKYIDIPLSNGFTNLYYGGTISNFRNVKLITNTYGQLPYVQCTDGYFYGPDRNYAYIGKSEQALYKGNQVRPAIYNEYFYANTENYNILTNSVTLVGKTATAPYSNSVDFYSRRGKKITVLSEITGITQDGYGYITLTLNEDIWGANIEYASDILRIIPVNGYIPFVVGDLSSGWGEPYTEMRGVEGGYLAFTNNPTWTENVPTALTLQNLRYIAGTNNFRNSPVVKLSVPNLIHLSDSTLQSATTIEEIYAPSLQVLDCYLPSSLTKLTIGKDFAFLDTNAFIFATGLLELFFNGTVAEFVRMCSSPYGRGYGGNSAIYPYEIERHFPTNSIGDTLEINSYIQVVYCADGEYAFTRE